MIRECFPTSVLLGSIERPVEPQVVVVVVVFSSVFVIVAVVFVVIFICVDVVMCVEPTLWGAWVGPCEDRERFYDTLMFQIVKFIIFAV